MGGLWGVAYAIMLLVTGRPLCSLLFALAMETILVLVSVAKYKSLREPFLYQDYDYFLDTLRFPRLFLPFLGVKSFLLAVAGCLLGVAALALEEPPAERWRLDGQAGSASLILIVSSAFLWLGNRRTREITLDPVADIKKFGFIPLLWIYGAENRKKELPESPFAVAKINRARELPHLVAIQSESFFDARAFFPGVKSELYANLEKFDSRSALWGELSVPAWGANTVRTEFAFLTGLAPSALGARGFNPYQSLARGWTPGSLPALLRRAGYQTIAVHPYFGQFYGRDRIFPRLGFDSFRDLKSFSRAPRNGPYIDDLALAETIIKIIAKASRPTFVFAISMENHGPLGLERIAPEHSLFYDSPPPDGCEELGVYLNHIKNCDRTLGVLYKAFSGRDPLSLCFYGDHIPILSDCYKVLSPPSGKTSYFCWRADREFNTSPRPEKAENLALKWLESLDLIERAN
ncbi:MAG: LTA synthase family protein [Desulfovibrio sp.]|nr:LTA synthase family protein [Desulfovibrio sp.]